jgi:ABC-type proline/glycine betaine transport system permease subunit
MDAEYGDPKVTSFAEYRKAASKMENDARPLSEILRESVRHIEEILRSEVRLAKIEVSQIAGNVAKKSAAAVAAAILSLYALNFLFWGGAYALAQIVPLWLAAIVVGVFLGIVATIVSLKARRDLTRFHPRMETTTETLKENLAWIKKRTT